MKLFTGLKKRLRCDEEKTKIVMRVKITKVMKMVMKVMKLMHSGARLLSQIRLSAHTTPDIRLFSPSSESAGRNPLKHQVPERIFDLPISISHDVRSSLGQKRTASSKYL